MAAADCIILPSFYRESTLEAAAMGRPVITTDMPGCRDVVEPGISGYLCSHRDGQELAASMERFIPLSDSERSAMGMAARAWMTRYFDEQQVIGA